MHCQPVFPITFYGESQVLEHLPRRHITLCPWIIELGIWLTILWDAAVNLYVEMKLTVGDIIVVLDIHILMNAKAGVLSYRPPP